MRKEVGDGNRKYGRIRAATFGSLVDTANAPCSGYVAYRQIDSVLRPPTNCSTACFRNRLTNVYSNTGNPG